MRAKGLLLAGVVALVVGLAGLLVVTFVAVPVGFPGGGLSSPGVVGPWGTGPGGAMGMPGMTAMMGGPVAPNVSPIGIELASAAAQRSIAPLGLPNLALGEVMEFLANYYVQVVERDTGVYAFELLVDKYTGVVVPEMGPNMVWNTRYGMTGGMMGWRALGPGALADMPIGPERAQELARQYVQVQGLPLDVAEPARFYGYYTLHTLRDGEIEGMLSVNGYTGEVWYHAWHGPFIPDLGSSARMGAPSAPRP
jgi:hypothetical protein